MDLKDLLMMDIVGENMGRKTFLELNIPGLFSSLLTHTQIGLILIQVCAFISTGAITGALTVLFKTAGRQSKCKDLMTTQLYLRSHTKERTCATSPLMEFHHRKSKGPDTIRHFWTWKLTWEWTLRTWTPSSPSHQHINYVTEKKITTFQWERILRCFYLQLHQKQTTSLQHPTISSTLEGLIIINIQNQISLTLSQPMRPPPTLQSEAWNSQLIK